jgi:hypothetical protein
VQRSEGPACTFTVHCIYYKQCILSSRTLAQTYTQGGNISSPVGNIVSNNCYLPPIAIHILLIHKRGVFCIFLVRYSALLHLPSLRIHRVRGCWDRTSNLGQLQLRHWLSDALTTRLDLIHTLLDLIHGWDLLIHIFSNSVTHLWELPIVNFYRVWWYSAERMKKVAFDLLMIIFTLLYFTHITKSLSSYMFCLLCRTWFSLVFVHLIRFSKTQLCFKRVGVRVMAPYQS